MKFTFKHNTQPYLSFEVGTKNEDNMITKISNPYNIKIPTVIGNKYDLNAANNFAMNNDWKLKYNHDDFDINALEEGGDKLIHDEDGDSHINEQKD